MQVDSLFLLRLRREALRRHVWFRVLDVTERAILTLAPRCVDRPRSGRLIGIVARIIVKIRDALKSRVAVHTSQVGWPLAERLSRIAVKWGHRAAGLWRCDREYARYLAVVDMNDASCFKRTEKGR